VTIAAFVALVVRYGLVVLFLPASALDKIVNFKGAVAQSEQTFKPRPLAVAAILAALAVEIFMSLGVVTGVADRMAALVMAAYCAATAVLFKRFWRPGDFWKPGDSQGRNLFWDFLKNLSLASGFLLITVGTDGAGLRPFLAHPLASSRPYAPEANHGV
jgi:putative oxidoreductase